jgi:hypothetical protein
MDIPYRTQSAVLDTEDSTYIRITIACHIAAKDQQVRFVKFPRV